MSMLVRRVKLVSRKRRVFELPNSGLDSRDELKKSKMS